MRFYTAATFDPVRGRTVIFGGSLTLDDLWEWGGERWVERELAGAPPGRQSHGLAYDTSRRALVLFGGVSMTQFVDDTWELVSD